VTLLGESRDDPGSVAGQVAKVIARGVVEEPERRQLGLEFAARATRDEQVREILTQLRRAQRDAAEASIVEVAERSGLRLAVRPEVAALILHCLTNGLSMEHLVDPEKVDAAAVEQAIAATITALTTPPPQNCAPATRQQPSPHTHRPQSGAVAFPAVWRSITLRTRR
jgi:hypothetical protein